MNINDFSAYNDTVAKTDYEKVLDDFMAMGERCVAKPYEDRIEQRRDMDMFRYYMTSTPARRVRYRELQVSQRGNNVLLINTGV